ncbi:hypothetical protein LCGC14_0374540 [marine sediment metagenome]|uniref:Uncharacterized protein n=1 Tax=marine sediment metagenome TaxID=412755 RepID=A0A0F9TA30_9ZZZZ
MVTSKTEGSSDIKARKKKKQRQRSSLEFLESKESLEFLQ